MTDSSGISQSTDIRGLVEHLVGVVEALQAEVHQLKPTGPVSPSTHSRSPIRRRLLPTDGDPVDLDVLAQWVTGLQVRYASETDWLRPCWWRHGFVVEELAALREAWLAAFDTPEPSDRAARLRWHEEADRCRERIRRTSSIGTGCSAASHVPDDLVSEDPRWIEESAAITASPNFHI